MTPKRRTRLSRSTSAANRMAAIRAAETSEGRQTQIDNQRTREAASRRVETSEERQIRIGIQLTRQTTSRAAETPDQIRARSEDQRTRQAALRAARWTILRVKHFDTIQQITTTAILNLTSDQ